MKLINRMNDFTINDNKGFKIAFGDIVVSICTHNFIEAMFAMRHNGVVGEMISNSPTALITPQDIPIFTFNNAEICIFNQKTDECLNKEIIDPYADDYEEFVDPEELVDILIKVRDYSKQYRGKIESEE